MGFTLSDVSGAYIALGLRKLRSDYSGDSFLVRRESDDATQSIGFDPSGLLSITGLESFCSGTNGYIVTWYDQSTYGYDAYQPDNSLQPKIVSSGNIIRGFNNDIAVRFDNDYLSGVCPTGLNNWGLTVYHMSESDLLFSDKNIFGLGRPMYYRLSIDSNTESLKIRTGTGSGGGSFPMGDSDRVGHSTYPFIFHHSLTTVGSSGYFRDFRLLIPTNSGYTNQQCISYEFFLGAQSTGSTSVIGNSACFLSELLVYSGLQETDRISVYDSMNEFYGIGPMSTGVHPSALLPQDYNWHISFYDWLETITVDDVITNPANFTWDGTYSDINELADIHQKMVALRQNAAEAENDHRIVRNLAKWWVLNDGSGAGIEGEGNLRIQLSDVGYIVPCSQFGWYYYNLNLPLSSGNGNPYYHSSGLLNRTLISMIVNLLVEDTGENASPTYFHDVWCMGGTINDGLKIYLEADAQGLIPLELKPTFIECFKWYAFKFYQIAKWKTSVNLMYSLGNLVAKSLPALAHLWLILDGYPEYQDFALNAAKLILFGSESGTPQTSDKGIGIYSPAGYIMENSGGPETTYNGRSLNDMLKVYEAVSGVPEWDFITDITNAMIDFKILNYFLNESGYVEGPSGYATRTGGSYVADQAVHRDRNLYAACLFPSGRPLARTLDDSGTMFTQISSIGLPYYNSSSIGVTYSGTPQTTGKSIDDHWAIEPWFNFPSGWYGFIKNLQDINDPSLLCPYQKDNTSTFNKSLGDEFWSYKNIYNGRHFGWLIEAIEQPWGGNGWFGGSLQSFWVEDIGPILLSRHDGAGSDYFGGVKENTRYWPVIEMWATHHFWGKGPLSTPSGFSTACCDLQTSSNIYSTFDVGANPPKVTVGCSIGTGQPGGSSAGQEISLLSGYYTFEKVFTALNNGLKIDHSFVKNSGIDIISELWCSFPVFLRDPNNSSSSTVDAVVDYWNGFSWVSLDNSLVTTTELRIGQNISGVYKYIHCSFDSSSEVRFNENVYVQGYQGVTRHRNIDINLLPTYGSDQLVPDSGSVTFSLLMNSPVEELLSNGVSDYLSNKILDQVLRSTTYVPPSSIYISLHSGSPGELGISEFSGGSYIRQSGGFIEASNGQTHNYNYVSFLNMPAGILTHVGLWDSLTSGNFLWGGQLPAYKIVDAGDIISISSGTLIINLD